MTAAPDIFLSYNREDQATARRFADAFERAGLSVWWDATLRSGEAYDQVTERALKIAKAVVVLWSRHSVDSRWVRAEATLADRNKTLVPAMIEPCDRPIMFELTQTADLSHWQGAASDPVWLAFLADVARFVERGRAPPHDAPAVVASGPAAGACASIAVAPASATAPASGVAVGERGDAPSLAVLPFTNRSGLADDDVFAIGMVEDLVDALSQGIYVRVLASAATARFRTGQTPELKALGRELGVRYFLEGNVRRTGANLRVTAQLIDALTGAILWTQRFDRPLTELAALQEQLVLEVAAHLNTQVHRVEMDRALKKPGDLTAWEAVMRAVAALRLTNVANISLCAEEAHKAVTIAPDYGLAHAVLAYAIAGRQHTTLSKDPAEVHRIHRHADRALDLDPDNALVLSYVSLALSLSGDPEDALRRAERALQLSPGAALAHYSCGMACVLLDRPDDALMHLEADIRASPGAHGNAVNFFVQGLAHIRAGRWSETIAACDRALALNPALPPALITKAVICHRSGLSAESRELLRRVRQAEQAGTLAVWEMSYDGFLGRSVVREEFLQHLRSLWSEAESAA